MLSDCIYLKKKVLCNLLCVLGLSGGREREMTGERNRWLSRLRQRDKKEKGVDSRQRDGGGETIDTVRR